MAPEQQKLEAQMLAAYAAADALCTRLSGLWYTYKNDYGYKVTGGLNAERTSPVVFYVRANPKAPRYAVHLRGEPDDDFVEANTVEEVINFAINRQLRILRETTEKLAALYALVRLNT